MPTVKLNELYDLEIRKLPVSDRLRLAQREPRSLLDLEGLGADLWKSVDGQDYVNRLREEWDKRP